jgi:acyl-CoA thioester hydrolase
MTDERYEVTVTARGYEVDPNGQVSGAVLLQYGQHARWECLRAAGADRTKLLEEGYGPVSLEERIRFHREVRAGDQLIVSCVFVWGGGKTFRVEQQLIGEDGELIAEITNVGGLMDLAERRLTTNPSKVWGAVARRPELLNI